MPSFELRHLRYFVAIAELGSVSRAAEKLFISQPPLSAQLKQLEQQVGTALFVRQAKGVSLTSAGRSFFEDAKSILARSEQAVERAREAESHQHSRLRLALVPSTTHSILPDFLRRLHEDSLNVRIQVSNMITSQQVRALRNDEIDIGFARVNEDDLPAEAIAAIDDPYCLALSRQSPLAREKGPVRLRQASKMSFVAFSRHQDMAYFDRALALCEEAGFKPEIKHDAGEFTSVLSLIACGLGVGIVPASFSTLPTAEVVFRRISDTRHQGRLAILRSSRLVRDAWTDSVLDRAIQSLSALGKQLKSFGSSGLTLHANARSGAPLRRRTSRRP